ASDWSAAIRDQRWKSEPSALRWRRRYGACARGARLILGSPPSATQSTRHRRRAPKPPSPRAHLRCLRRPTQAKGRRRRQRSAPEPGSASRRNCVRPPPSPGRPPPRCRRRAPFWPHRRTQSAPIPTRLHRAGALCGLSRGAPNERIQWARALLRRHELRVIIEDRDEIDVEGHCGLLAHFLDHGTELLRGREADPDRANSSATAHRKREVRYAGESHARACKRVLAAKALGEPRNDVAHVVPL